MPSCGVLRGIALCNFGLGLTRYHHSLAVSLVFSLPLTVHIVSFFFFFFCVKEVGRPPGRSQLSSIAICRRCESIFEHKRRICNLFWDVRSLMILWYWCNTDTTPLFRCRMHLFRAPPWFRHSTACDSPSIIFSWLVGARIHAH